jgi:hypothetical protein
LIVLFSANKPIVFFWSVTPEKPHSSINEPISGASSSGYDSCIVPLDFQKVGVISDDSLKYYFNKIPAGVSMFCVFDACHSASCCDLKYNCFDTSYRKDITVKMKDFKYNDWIRRQMIKVDNKQIDTKADIISLSGCTDSQTSVDLGRNGALTLALLQTFKKFSKIIAGLFDISVFISTD